MMRKKEPKGLFSQPVVIEPGRIDSNSVNIYAQIMMSAKTGDWQQAKANILEVLIN